MSTEDGTGIVHIAPTFGADDDRVAKQAGIAPMLLVDKDGNKQPMVDKRGRLFVLEEIDPEFVKSHVNTKLYSEYAGRFVKNAYDPQLTEEDATLDIDLSVMLPGWEMAGKSGRLEPFAFTLLGHSAPHLGK